jgi:hypothetical protein
MLIMKKKNFLLFEILIALCLMGVVLCTLVTFFARSVIQEKKLASMHEIVMTRQRLHLRLSDLILRVASSFTLEEGSLSFEFDMGVDVDPKFSGRQVGKLGLDDKGHLCFSYHPKIEASEKLERKEVLLEGVQSLSFEFLEPSENKKRAFLWTKGQFNKMPAMIKIKVKQNQEIEFVYPIPGAGYIPTYRGG